MFTAVFASFATIFGMWLIVRHFDKKRKKDLADAERHKKEFLDYLLDDFEKKIS